jgi:hypothetical protein
VSHREAERNGNERRDREPREHASGLCMTARGSSPSATIRTNSVAIFDGSGMRGFFDALPMACHNASATTGNAVPSAMRVAMAVISKPPIPAPTA